MTIWPPLWLWTTSAVHANKILQLPLWLSVVISSPTVLLSCRCLMTPNTNITSSYGCWSAKEILVRSFERWYRVWILFVVLSFNTVLVIFSLLSRQLQLHPRNMRMSWRALVTALMDIFCVWKTTTMKRAEFLCIISALHEWMHRNPYYTGKFLLLHRCCFSHTKGHWRFPTHSHNA